MLHIAILAVFALPTVGLPQLANAPVHQGSANVQQPDDANQPEQPAPISVTVNTQKSPEELEADREDREKDREIQASMADFNGELVWVGWVSVFLSAVGVIVAFLAAKSARDAAIAAKQSAKSADDSVAVMNKQGAVLAQQTAILRSEEAEIRRQADAMDRTLEATREAAEAAKLSAVAAMDALMLNRPYLELTNPRIIHLDGSSGRHGQIRDLQARFDVHNFGHTAARIDRVEGHCILGLNGTTLTHVDTPRVMVMPGASTPLDIYLGFLSIEQELAVLNERKRAHIEVGGNLFYTDQFGRTHERSFGWWFSYGYEDTTSQLIALAGRNEEKDWGIDQGQEPT